MSFSCFPPEIFSSHLQERNFNHTSTYQASACFTPENNVDTQRIIGADIIMALDECTPGDADRNYAAKSLDLTQKWLERGIRRYKETEPLYGYHQTYFPIVQGCIYPDLRRKAAEHAAKFDMEGYAIGGLSVGEPTEVM